MNIQIEPWHLIGAIVSVCGTFWALAKVLIASTDRMIERRFNEIASSLKNQDESSRRLERDLMDLKAELPRDYVRREDYSITISTVMVKIDSLALRMEQAIREVYANASKGAHHDR